MPVMDGYEAILRLRSSNYKGPVVALTAHAMLDEKRHCLELGFDAHLSKPITRKMLLQTVAKYVL